MRQSSKKSTAVSEERLPTFSSLRETSKPGTSVGKVTSEMPP